YFAHLYLDQGEILIQLYPEQAPATVASFMFLAEQGWYDRIGFHTVQAGTLVESGDPSGTGLGGPGYLLFDELSDTLNFNEIGMLAMSSSGPDTNGSRFFINLVPLPHLNGSRTIFGRVLKGLDLLMQLDERDPYLDLFEPYMLVIDTIAIERR
ncbi:MAG: peptidylprolyl isomerase, partial [Anaerolineales bacterium]